MRNTGTAAIFTIATAGRSGRRRTFATHRRSCSRLQDPGLRRGRHRCSTVRCVERKAGDRVSMPSCCACRRSPTPPGPAATATTTSCGAARCCTPTSRCWSLRTAIEPASTSPPLGPQRFRMQISDGRQTDLGAGRGALGNRPHGARLRAAGAARRAGAGRDDDGPPVVPRDRGVDAAGRRPRHGAPRSRARDVSSRSRHPVPERHASVKRMPAPRDSERRAIRGPADRCVDSTSSRNAASCGRPKRFFRRALRDRAGPRRSPAAAAAACWGSSAGTPTRRESFGRRWPSADDDLLRYYGELFLGAEEEALGTVRRRASTPTSGRRRCIRPRSRRGSRSAASARRRGDRAAALRALQQLFDLPSDRRSSATIRGGPTTSRRRATSTTLLEALRQPFLRGARAVKRALADRAAGARAARAGGHRRRAAEPGVLGESRSGSRRRARHRRENGPAVLGLGPSDFEVYDNGVPQQVDLVSFDEVPLNVILALDMSDSVAGERLEQLRGAGAALLAGAEERRPGGARHRSATWSRSAPALTHDVGAGAARARRRGGVGGHRARRRHLCRDHARRVRCRPRAGDRVQRRRRHLELAVGRRGPRPPQSAPTSSSTACRRSRA